MSLITTCPQCGTAFIVKPEHLAAHRGEVRCGHCRYQFNALEHLAEMPPAEHLPSQDAQEIASVVADVTADAASTDDNTSDFTDTPPPASVEADHFASEIDSEQEETSAEPPVPTSPWETPQLRPPEPAPVVPEEAADTQTTDAAPPEPEPEPEAEPERRIVRPAPATLGESSFLAPPAQRRSHALPYAVLAALLLLAAIGQTAYFMRTELAVRLPQSKPLLLQACLFLGCKVELPRNIDEISIEDSDLQEDSALVDVMRLTSTLLNNSRTPQQYPLLELTLTDVNDAAVLRRLLQPQEYLPAGSDIAGGMPPGKEILVSLPLTTGNIKAAGYRVYITYP